MPILTLYQICLIGARKIARYNSNRFHQLPNTCLHDLLPHLSPIELERFDPICHQRRISINDLWRRHFELIWSLSRDDKDAYESRRDIPYKRLYFEYLFHDTQILQLGIYAQLAQLNQSKPILDLSFVEQINYHLTRDSIIYCSKRRLVEENQTLLINWNHQWDRYIKRFILVPHVWNLAKIDPLLIHCFTENVTDIVLSGYPTENDIRGMKFILDVLTRGHITNMVIKFPSYCLLNILLPLLISPRSYSLSYLSSIEGTDSEQSSLFTQNYFLPHRRKKLCLQVQIHSNDNQSNPSRMAPIHEHAVEEDDHPSLNTTHAVASDSLNSLHESIDFPSSPPNTAVRVHSSIVAMRNDSLQFILQRHRADEPTMDSSHLVSPLDIDRSTIEPHLRLLPYLNRSRALPQYPAFPLLLTPARHLSVSEQSVLTHPPAANTIIQPLSTSDSDLFRRRTTTSALPERERFARPEEDDVVEEKHVILHLTPQYQTNSLTTLSIYYVSSIEAIDMIAIALLGMRQIQHLTLVNFAIYSSRLETSLITLCDRSQLQTLQLTSISLLHGAVGFLFHLFRQQTIPLQRLRLDAIKMFASVNDHVHLSDIEQAEFSSAASLQQLIWRERHMQYIHIRLLHRLLPSLRTKLSRLELSSILECAVLDQFSWGQTFLHHIPDLRLRNFRIRAVRLSRLFEALNTPCTLTVFHFERVGLLWNNDQQTSIIDEAFTFLIRRGTHLTELSLAYNNLNDHFMHWLCHVLLREDINTAHEKTSWWSIVTLNLTFNLISSASMWTLGQTLKEYRDRWSIRASPLRRIDILGNAIEMRELPNLKKHFNALGCELISYIFFFLLTLH